LGALGVALVGVLLVLVANSLVAEVRTVGSGSMRPTLAPNERILVTKAGVDRWALDRGAVVLFDAADLWVPAGDPEGTVFVKRVIGVPGDRITCCSPQGQLARNGQALVEPYLADPRTDQQSFDVVVPAGHYWLMGDDRADSADARSHLGDPGGGNVPASRIIGTVAAVVWPPSALRRVEGLDDTAG
jgi:signal peptidase I